ncbi:MAG: hypothetical protein RL077_3218 [Verrucomicrobiota bacterium]
MNENLQPLEEKIAYLERHVTEQDKVMLEFADELKSLRRELKAMRERSNDSGPGGSVEESPADTRPPHY